MTKHDVPLWMSEKIENVIIWIRDALISVAMLGAVIGTMFVGISSYYDKNYYLLTYSVCVGVTLWLFFRATGWFDKNS